MASAGQTLSVRPGGFLPALDSKVNVRGWSFVVAFTVVLEIVVRAGLLSEYFPPPSLIVTTLVRELFTGSLALHVLATLVAYGEGLVLAAVLGVLVGVLMGTFRTFYDAIKVIVEFLRPIPSVAIIPLAILVFGLGTYSMRVTVIAYAAFWPILFNTFYGVRSIDPVAVDTARNFGLSSAQILRRVTLPSALTSVATGFRVSAAMAIHLTVTAELVAGSSGIGFYVGRMEEVGRTPELYAGILLAGILGYLLNTLFRLVERRGVFWTAAYGERGA